MTNPAFNPFQDAHSWDDVIHDNKSPGLWRDQEHRRIDQMSNPTIKGDIDTLVNTFVRTTHGLEVTAPEQGAALNALARLVTGLLEDIHAIAVAATNADRSANVPAKKA